MTSTVYDVYFTATPCEKLVETLSAHEGTRKVAEGMYALGVAIIAGYTTASRSDFQRLVEVNTEGLTDIDLVCAIPAGSNDLPPLVFKVPA